jgi:hypothetical protein
MHRATLITLFVLVACVSAQSVLLYKARTTAARMESSDQKRRTFCGFYRSMLSTTRFDLAEGLDPGDQARAFWRFRWLTWPEFVNACDVNWDAFSKQIDHAAICWLSRGDASCAVDVLQKVEDAVPVMR